MKEGIKMTEREIATPFKLKVRMKRGRSLRLDKVFLFGALQRWNDSFVLRLCLLWQINTYISSFFSQTKIFIGKNVVVWTTTQMKLSWLFCCIDSYGVRQLVCCAESWPHAPPLSDPFTTSVNFKDELIWPIKTWKCNWVRKRNDYWLATISKEPDVDKRDFLAFCSIIIIIMIIKNVNRK